MEDGAIVELYWARSERAIEESDAKYGRMLRGISVSLVAHETEADECLNDTYLAAWNSMPDNRPTYLGAYLAKIVRRISIGRFRAAKAKSRQGYDLILDELEDCIPDSFDVQGELDNRGLAEALNRFLVALDKERRYAFVRRYFYSDPIEKIARELSSSVGRIKTMLFRTRAHLRSFLEKEGIPL